MRYSRSFLCVLAFAGAAFSLSVGCSNHSDDSTEQGTGGKTKGTKVQGALGGDNAKGGAGGADSGGDSGGESTAIAQTSGGATGSGGAGIGGAGIGSAGTGAAPSGGGANAGSAGRANAGASGQSTSPQGGKGSTHAGGRSNAGAAGVAGQGNAITCAVEAEITCTLTGTALGPSPQDSDCDGIPDAIEIGPNGKAPRDTDGDGTPDHQDPDSDGDGVPDRVEIGSSCNLPRDADDDGLPDYRDPDADQNGILDSSESVVDTDSDALPDVADSDDDGDFLTDLLELGNAPSAPRDTDADGIADFKDPDSDNDGIADRDERASDADGDTLPNYRDLDSDGDGIVDAAEAGDNAIATPPIDTDGDGLPDFLDLDSDGDGLLDAAEDPNRNGNVDPSETDRIKTDTDGDGISDLIEVAAKTNPNDPSDNPGVRGNFVFLEPYRQAPSPSIGTLDFATKIALADIFLLIDTTRSMDGEIANLQQSLASLIIPKLASEIDSIAIGVGSYRDFPTAPHGSLGDWPFKLDHRIMTVRTPAGIASLQAAVNGLSAGGGNDYYEASWEALHQVAKGVGNATGSANVPPFDTNSSFPTVALDGEAIGSIPGVGFRRGALPIAVLFTDAPGHNTDSPTVTASDYGPSSGVTSAHSTQVINELKALSARLIGVTSGTADARDDALAAITATGAVVPPNAWGNGDARPVGCAPNQCCTGLSGTGESPLAGNSCPLSFRMQSDGSGLGTAVVAAIEVLTSYGTIDVSAHPLDDTSDSVDAVAAFIDGVIANPTAGPPCDSGLTAADLDGDGRLDTFTNVLPGKRVCFDVIPKTNRTVPAQETPQMYQASIAILGDAVTVLDTRNVFFLVPPAAPQ